MGKRKWGERRKRREERKGKKSKEKRKPSYHFLLVSPKWNQETLRLISSDCIRSTRINGFNNKATTVANRSGRCKPCSALSSAMVFTHLPQPLNGSGIWKSAQNLLSSSMAVTPGPLPVNTNFSLPHYSVSLGGILHVNSTVKQMLCSWPVSENSWELAHAGSFNSTAYSLSCSFIYELFMYLVGLRPKPDIHTC